MPSPAETPQVASCTCGSLRVTVSGPPRSTYLCSCDSCKRTTGSAFGYRAQYAHAAVAIEGPRKSWRRSSDSGRWVDHVFCPDCGAMVYMEGEGLDDAIVISVGSFADRAFAPPASAHRTSAGFLWVTLPAGIRVVS